MNAPFVLTKMKNWANLFFELIWVDLRVMLTQICSICFWISAFIGVPFSTHPNHPLFVSAHLQSLWVQTWFTTRSITQRRVHLKDLSERTGVVSTEALVFSLFSRSNDPNMSSHTLQTSWNIADTGSRMGSSGTRLRLFLEGDKFQA